LSPLWAQDFIPRPFWSKAEVHLVALFGWNARIDLLRGFLMAHDTSLGIISDKPPGYQARVLWEIARKLLDEPPADDTMEQWGFTAEDHGEEETPEPPSPPPPPPPPQSPWMSPQ
jgi:hypothetical protein